MRKVLLTVSAVLLFALLCGMSVAAVRETARANEMSLRYENSLKASYAHVGGGFIKTDDNVYPAERNAFGNRT